MLKIRQLPVFSNSKVFKAYMSSAIAKEEKIKVGEWNINYVKVGNGPHKVLCIPGALGSIWTDFKPQVEGLNRDKFTVVAWDPPGYGKSRPPERDFPVDFYERDAQFTHDFMKALHIDQYSVLGWSDGGITAMILAAKQPQVIHKMAVWGANAFILPKEMEIYQNIKDVNKWSKRMRDPMIAVYGEELFAEYWAQWVDGMTNLYKEKDGNIATEYLKNIRCPTLILYGEKDPMVDNSHASHLHTNIEGSQLILYPDGKHNIHLSYADDFNKKIENFLSV